MGRSREEGPRDRAREARDDGRGGREIDRAREARDHLPSDGFVFIFYIFYDYKSKIKNENNIS